MTPTIAAEEQRPIKRARRVPGDHQYTVPTFAGSLAATIDSDEFSQAWETFQLAFLPREETTKEIAFTWKHIHELFLNLTEKDKASFCVETASKGLKSEASVPSSEPEPHAFFQVSLDQDSTTTPKPPYYTSFLIQNDESSLKNMLSQVPVPVVNGKWSHEPCVWLFFGRNPSDGDDLQGRPEHTDSVSHDGTWHYQLSGIKRWLLRPTSKLLDQWKAQGNKDLARWEECSDHRMTVECREGDILVINTRLWFHQTILPPQPDPSVSYARDFWIRPKLMSPLDEADGCMTNVDGLYATEDIAEGTIIFNETDMPDCELHRSSENPNCEIVELDDGTSAVISLRPIAAGEFFCVVESDDEEFEEDEFEEEELEEEDE